ncbi:MAG: HAMP domain-containing sensor histidine kinase [Candidatus Marinimicrobia bacterium]|nr:HAMP domain-containing sensor histidine kinase [Candidatus Neomarinimicrobiota bacterium]MDD5582279.1 HAMP domain-containing sensor histidine kinase [Candidatus Neomarinimicrobiota bacterium]
MINSSRIKLILALVSFLFIVGILFYSQKNIHELRREAKEVLLFYTELYARIASEESFTDFTFLFDEVLSRISFPIIVTGRENHEISAWKNIHDIPDTTQISPVIYHELIEKVELFDKYTEPVPLTYDTLVVGYIHYGDSPTIRRLRWMPYIELGGVILLIFIGFVFFQYIRSSEKKFIWVGMAKETAHQLGTPISSLMGWLAIAQETFWKHHEIFDEMDADIQRLEKISNRFSQIGSDVQMNPIDLYEVLTHVKQYMERRIPQKNKRIRIDFDIETTRKILGNSDLLEWGMENLIKNAVDAIGDQEGEIYVRVINKNDKKIYIDVSDSGRGIPESQWKTIFKPGYSTKKRGWGLGLSLTKRIFEEYHHGRIYVLRSKEGEGTTIRIELRTSTHRK